MSNSVGKRVIKVGEEFAIKLESNITTGYSWQAIFDENILKLTSKDIIPITKLIGSSGVARFSFTAIKPGITVVKMIYKRQWENNSIKEKEFSFNII